MRNPYAGKPGYTRWKSGVASPAPALVDPVTNFPFRIAPHHRVATAGSCFAQHIARHLGAAGLTYYVAERAHPLAPPETGTAFGYGLFSARYGNIYTTRQLVQLFDRAHGHITPADDIWVQDGRTFDPYRPAVQPGGFRSEREFRLDREQHYAAIRTMFQELDVFVFTLGLTECWHSAQDGMAYPTCPGTIAGQFDPAQHAFTNLGPAEVIADLEGFIERLGRVNPAARIILTVSPVPLAATALDQHVLVSTTYSKAVLRVAAQAVTDKHAHVAYFPSYEIITGNFSRGGYYADNLRDVTEDGVNHVMRLFMHHATEGATTLPPAVPDPVVASSEDFVAEMKRVVAVICEEAALDPAA